MKTVLTACFLTLTLAFASAQSNSFQTLQDHFQGLPEVYSFKFSGFVGRTVLAIAAPEEKLIRTALDDVRNYRMIVIPRKEFNNQNLSIKGFTAVLKKDSFDELAHITDNRDNVRLYHRSEGNNKDRYFVLIDEIEEVIAIEIKGYINTDVLIEEIRRSKTI